MLEAVSMCHLLVTLVLAPIVLALLCFDDFHFQVESFRFEDKSTILVWPCFSDPPKCRRSALQSLVVISASPMVSTATVSSLLVGNPGAPQADATATANSPTTEAAAEAIRRGASKTIPGLGLPDVYYPAAFQGSWTMHREVLDLNTGTVASTLDYKVRFLPITDLDGQSDDLLVVADRGYNEINREAAASNGDASVVQSCDWKDTNPNDLRVQFRTGRTKDIKVTKRATERTNATVFSSEFRRVVNQENAQGIPAVTAERVLTKWKVRDDGLIAGLELVYDVGGSAFANPLAVQVSAQSQEPLLISKCRLTLERF